MLTRRGFLGTMLAAAAGAAASFDPLKKLWVPGAPIVTTAEPQIIIPQTTWTKAVVDVQAELNDLALRFAQAMAPRLERSHATVLRRVMLQHTGHADIGRVLLTDDEGRPAGSGHFAPAMYRIAKELPTYSPGIADHLGWASNEMAVAVRPFDAFAPIGAELRAGVPFADCLVGIATDPESGLSARALRFKTVDGVLHTECELAVGDWHGGAHARRRKGQTARIFSLPPEQVAAQEAVWAQMATQTPISLHGADVGDSHQSASTGKDDKIHMRYVKEWDIET